jgi:hypothetical protein
LSLFRFSFFIIQSKRRSTQLHILLAISETSFFLGHQENTKINITDLLTHPSLLRPWPPFHLSTSPIEMVAIAPRPTTLPAFQAWLIDRRAPQKIGKPVEEIEVLFEPMLRGYIDTTTDLNISDRSKESKPLDTSSRRLPPFDKKALQYVLALKNAPYTVAHGAMKRCVDEGIRMWNLSDKEAVVLLSTIDSIWEPVCRITDGNAEYAKDVFGDCTYFDALLKALQRVAGSLFGIGADESGLGAIGGQYGDTWVYRNGDTNARSGSSGSSGS